VIPSRVGVRCLSDHCRWRRDETESRMSLMKPSRHDMVLMFRVSNVKLHRIQLLVPVVALIFRSVLYYLATLNLKEWCRLPQVVRPIHRHARASVDLYGFIEHAASWPAALDLSHGRASDQ
jgi:hypothetical protein